MKKENNVKISNLLLIFTLFLFLGLIIRVSFIAISPTVDNINIQELASKRTTKTTILKLAGLEKKPEEKKEKYTKMLRNIVY